MPHTGTTLCHPKIGYVNAMLLFRSRHLAINSPLGHFNGDNAYSPSKKYQTHEIHGDIQSSFTPTATWLSLNYSEHNPSHVRRHVLPFQPSQLLITQFRLNTHNLSTSLAAPKANPIFPAANKTYSPKHISTMAILLLHSSFITLQT